MYLIGPFSAEFTKHVLHPLGGYLITMLGGYVDVMVPAVENFTHALKGGSPKPTDNQVVDYLVDKAAANAIEQKARAPRTCCP